MYTALKRRFGRARGHIADGRPSTLLEIRDRRTYVVGGAGDTPDFYEALSIGARSLTEAYLANSPPSAMDPERAIKVTDPSGETTWTYNNFGQVTAKSHKIGTVTLTTAYGYDAGGRLTTMTLRSGKVITYGYGVTVD